MLLDFFIFVKEVKMIFYCNFLIVSKIEYFFLCLRFFLMKCLFILFLYFLINFLIFFYRFVEIFCILGRGVYSGYKL